MLRGSRRRGKAKGIQHGTGDVVLLLYNSTRSGGSGVLSWGPGRTQEG